MRRFATCSRTALVVMGLMLGVSSHAALAQSVSSGDGSSRPVVQPVGGGQGQALNAALARLARDPRNPSALIDAGNAALNMGDVDAAVGFFTRADQVSPDNGTVKAQIGSAMLRGEDPFAALRWFDDAEKSGADTVAMAQDRGLAFDLAGDNAAAQRQYQLALSRGVNDEATRRYALSLAIAGDRRGAEAILAPLLQRQERAAWRVRTFIMAIAGNTDEAVSIARASMPPDLAESIAPYLRYMPRLTAAQQAAAANLGRFPRAADIGRDDPRVVQYASLHPRAPRVDSSLIPVGQSLGGHGKDDKANRAKRRRPGQDEVRVALNTASQPPITPPLTSRTSSPPPIPASNAASQPLGSSLAARPQAVAPPSATPAPVVAAPGFDLSRVQGSTGVAPSAVATGSPIPQPPVLAKIDMPPGGVQQTVPTQGAVKAPTVIAVPTAPKPVSAPLPSSSMAAPSASVPPAQAVTTTIAPAPNVPAPSVPVPATGAIVTVPVPAPATTTAVPVVQAIPPSPPANDFRSLFEGFQAPPEELQTSVAAVDITRITPAKRAEARPPAVEPIRDQKAGKGAKDEEDGKASIDSRTRSRPAKDAKAVDEQAPCKPVNAKEMGRKAKAVAKAGKKTAVDDQCGSDKRGLRPDGPNSVSRTSDEKGGKDAKSKGAISHPSRIWVQVLTGSDRSRMASEWRSMVKQASALKGRKPFITPWRSNFRMLTGPFESDAAAQDFIRSLRKDGVSGFQWTSPAGQAVDSLPAK